MSHSTTSTIATNDLTKWLRISELVVKYPQFSESMIRRLVWKRHENNFIHCCRVVNKRSFIHEVLFAEWLIRDADKSPKVA